MQKTLSASYFQGTALAMWLQSQSHLNQSHLELSHSLSPILAYVKHSVKLFKKSHQRQRHSYKYGWNFALHQQIRGHFGMSSFCPHKMHSCAKKKWTFFWTWRQLVQWCNFTMFQSKASSLKNTHRFFIRLLTDYALTTWNSDLPFEQISILWFQSLNISNKFNCTYLRKKKMKIHYK